MNHNIKTKYPVLGLNGVKTREAEWSVLPSIYNSEQLTSFNLENILYRCP